MQEKAMINKLQKIKEKILNNKKLNKVDKYILNSLIECSILDLNNYVEEAKNVNDSTGRK